MKGQAQLTSEDKFALKAAAALMNFPPRLVSVQPSEKVKWVFTDAAVEGELGDEGRIITVGGLLFEPSSLKPR
eukprot:6487359-Amphidinium_carterae.1